MSRMGRHLGLAGSMSVLLLAAASPALAAGEDTPDSVQRECGERGLPRDLLSTCLERARLVNEQTPSPALQGLIARLEQRAQTEPGNDLMPPPPRDNSQVYSQPLPGEGGSSLPPPPAAQRPPAQLYNQTPPPPDNGYDDEDDGYGNDQGYPPPEAAPDNSYPQQAAPDDNTPPQASPYDDSDEPPIEGEDDGYDNSQPEPGYDTPDPPDPNWPPPGGRYDDGTDEY